MSIELHTVDNGNVQAINDGRLYGEFTGNVGGIVNGSVVTSAGGLALHVTSGWGIGYGRVFTITADDYTVQPASSGTQKGRLYVHIDISQPDNPIDIRSVAAASLPPLVQQNLSEGGAIYEIELAHYDVTALAVSNLVSNTKVVFAGHAGTADNALQLGGVVASEYMPKSGGAFSGNISAPNMARFEFQFSNNGEFDVEMVAGAAMYVLFAGSAGPAGSDGQGCCYIVKTPYNWSSGFPAMSNYKIGGAMNISSIAYDQSTNKVHIKFSQGYTSLYILKR